MLSRFHLIPERYGQTADGHMDRIAISISRVSVLKRDKKSHDSLVGYGQEYGPLPVFKFSLRGNLLGEISAGCYISCRPIRLLRRDKVHNVACRPISNAKTAVHDNKFNSLTATLKPDHYTAIRYITVDGWGVIFGTVPALLYQMQQPTHQRPVCQLHIIRFD